jgi:hypothetical protein
MGASRMKGNYTDVSVDYFPERPNKRPVLKVTVHIGAIRSDEEHIAFQRLLTAVKLLKEAST